MTDESRPSSQSRRDFLAASAATGAALLATGQYAFPQGSSELRVGLIGCGGRGTGAAAQALAADQGAVLTAVADVVQTQIDNSLAALKGETTVASRVQVSPDKQFIGLDAYHELLSSGVDVALIASPPGFHPQHIEATVAAGKHTFAEKPMGTDAVGVHKALAATQEAKAKGLSFVAGFCWRYDQPRRELYSRVLNGAIGPVRGVHATYLTGPVRPMPPASARPAGMSDVEWQIRNWYNFVWLSGDGLIEQACHSVDKILWAMGDVPPSKCVATGGRVLPNNEGNIYDHIDVFYEWPDGRRATMAQRQIPCQANDNSDYITGATGVAFSGWSGVEIRGKKNWRFSGPSKNMYQVEHDELFASIRSGKPMNDGEHMARSTMVALMGRMAAYTGEEITWEHMQTSQESLFPTGLSWNGSLAIPPMAIPGVTKSV